MFRTRIGLSLFEELLNNPLRISLFPFLYFYSYNHHLFRVTTMQFKVSVDCCDTVLQFSLINVLIHSAIPASLPKHTISTK